MLLFWQHLCWTAAELDQASVQYIKYMQCTGFGLKSADCLVSHFLHTAEQMLYVFQSNQPLLPSS